MRRFLFCVFVYLLSGLLPPVAHAQLVVTTGQTQQQLVNSIVGAGYLVQNIKLNCPSLAIGTFTSNGTNLGLTGGMILTTGNVNLARGPNNNVSAGFNNGTPGDNQLDTLSKATTYDACVLEFDLIPACDSLTITYVFGSEEYPEFVGREFNDVFAFIISGPGIPNGTKNIALVPATNNNVSINTINSGVNPGFYVNNTGGATIQYDGFTRPLVASAKVIPCELYHLKLAIADVADGIFESGVFIEGNTIDCSPVVYNDLASNVDGIEACNSGSFTFCRTGDSTQAFTVKYVIGGTAQNGIDYVQIPDSIVIPAGQRCASVNVQTIDDGLPEQPEILEVYYQYGLCPKNDTLRILITDPVPIDAGPDIMFCSGDTAVMGLPPSTNNVYSWSPVGGLGTPLSSATTVSLTNNGSTAQTYNYVLTVTQDTTCTLRDTLRVTVRPAPLANFTGQNVCIGNQSQFTDLSTAPPGSSIKQWYWSFGSSLLDTSRNPAPFFQTPGNYTVNLIVTDQFGCTDDTTKTVDVWDSPDAAFTFDTACIGSPLTFTNQSTVPSGTMTSNTWTFGDGTVPVTISSPVHQYNTAGIFTVKLVVVSDMGCKDSISKLATVAPSPTVIFSTSNVCRRDSAKFVNGSVADSWYWDFGDGTTSTLRNPFHAYDTVGTFTVKLVALNKYGCTDSTMRTITVSPLPVADYTTDTSAGCAPLCIDFLGGSADTLSGWDWIFAPGFLATGKATTFCFDKPGDFSPTLIATSNKGCKDTVIKQSFVTVYPKPGAFFTTDKYTISVFDPVVKIKDGSSGGSMLDWNFGDGTTDINKYNFEHRYAQPGTFTITQIVTNVEGCSDTFYLNVIVQDESTIYIPNAFTPNGDGNNDSFIPKLTGPLLSADFKMFIHDRWGDKIFETSSLSDPWDGKANGRTRKDIAQSDVYTYIILFKQPGTREVIGRYTGIVNLIK